MVRQRGTSWQADAVIGGKRVRRSFPSLAEASTYEAEHGTTKSTIGAVLPPLAREFWGGTKDERNALRIADELVDRLGLITSLRQAGNSPSTIRTKTTRLSKLLKKASRAHNFTMPFIEPQKPSQGRLRFLLPEEQELIFARLRPSERLLATFLVETGVRVSEALRLEWREVVRDCSSVTLIDTKSGRDRTVPLTRSAQACLGERSFSRVFDGLEYRPFYDAFVRAVRNAGIPRGDEVVVHTLRHTCASRLVQGGLGLRQVQEWLGHSAIQTTLRYAHLAPDSLKAGLEALERMRN
jgi:integrase